MKSFKITQTITNRQDDSLRIYMKDISRESLIDAKEEIKLAKQIKQGNRLAADKLIRSNLRFVISVAKQYQNKGIPLVDLIQAGNCGLIEASKRWNEERGYKFISYAVWWIRQSIIYAISSECRTIRVPMNQIVSMNKIAKAFNKLEQKLNRTPSVEELSNETDLNSDKINLTLSSINKAFSLDSPLKDEEVGCLLDIIPDENSINADKDAVQHSISIEIESILKTLSNREEDILRMSFGIGMLSMNLEEIACRFGIGSERVRQIQQETLKKIREEYGDTLKELL